MAWSAARTTGMIVAITVLAGCAPVEPVPSPGLSADELAEFLQMRSDSSWRALGLADELRPADAAVTIATSEQWWELLRDCMVGEGFERFGESPDPYVQQGRLPSLDYRLAEFSCHQRVVLDPVESGILNSAQSEYAYSYFQQTLIPCLAHRGVTVDIAPTQEEFHQGYGLWNPYFAVDPELSAKVLSDSELIAACPPVAPGIPDRGLLG